MRGVVHWRRLQWSGNLSLSCRIISITLVSFSCRELHSDRGGIVMPFAYYDVLIEGDSVVSKRVWPLPTCAYHNPFVKYIFRVAIFSSWLSRKIIEPLPESISPLCIHCCSRPWDSLTWQSGLITEPLASLL